MASQRKQKQKGFRTWKSGKKWLVSGTIATTVLFGPTNVVGAAEAVTTAVSESQADPNSEESTIQTETLSSTETATENSVENISENQKETQTQDTTSESVPATVEQTEDTSAVTPVPQMSGLTLDMDASTTGVENSVSYNLTADGLGWPNSASNTKQFSVSSTVAAGDTIKITLPKYVKVQVYDTPQGATVAQKNVDGATQLIYTFSTAGVNSFNISYFFVDQGNNHQFAPGENTLPVTVEGDGKTLSGSIIANNPVESTLTARTHNTAVSNNTYTADGNSVYNFVLGIKTTPDFTTSSAGITQAQRAKVSGVIHVPAGFVLTGGSLANYNDTDKNVPSDGSAVPGIPAGLSQPGGPGTDIVVSDVVGAGYMNLNEAYMYLYGYFAAGTPAGTYHFTPELTATPQYYDGTTGSIPISNGSLADITLGEANSGAMVPMLGGVLEGYDGNIIDVDHEGFYSKTISDATGITGFVTGKSDDTSVNNFAATPNLSINFLDDTVNQTNDLKDYKYTLPKNWRGNLSDISISTGPNGLINNNGNLNNVGPFTVTLDNGAVYTVSSLASNDATVTAALNAGAHIASVAGQAKILAGNNLEITLLNAVIEDGTYNNGDSVPMQLDVHSVTSNTDATAIGHLKYFDENVNSGTQFSIKNTVDYNISGTYTQGQKFTTGSKWTLLNQETALDSDITGKLIIPGSVVKDTTAEVKLPTLIISSVDHGMIDLDQSKLSEWGWTYNGKKYYPVITDLGTDSTTGEHLTKLDFSKETVTIPGDTNPKAAFFYPDALPWKVSDTASPATGTTSHWITQLTDNNKDDLHPTFGGKVYDGSTGMKWTITAPSVIASAAGLSGSKTGETNFYTETNGMAGFDRGLKASADDDNNSGKVMLSVTNGSNTPYTNVQTLAVLPSIENGDSFTLALSRPVENLAGEGAQVVYSTKSYSLPANGADTPVDLSTNDWVTEEQVTDWTSIRSVAIKADQLVSQKVLSGYLPVSVSKIEDTTIGDTAEVQSYAYAKGTLTGGDLSVNTPMKAQIYGISQIHVHYEETTDGSTSNGKELASVETLTGEDTNGEEPVTYKSDKKDISGYTYKGLAKDSSPASGTLTDDTADVTYLYTKNPVAGGDVTAKYVDEDGNEIAESVVKTGNVGEDYTTDQKDIDGYTFKEVQGDTAGTFTEDAQTVTYVYTKNPVAGGDVTARYVDEDGNEIAESVVKTGNVGEDYTTDQKDIDGYTFKEVQGNATGQFTEDTQTVTYVYTKNPVAGGDVTARYVDEDGNEIAESVVKTGNVGEDYTTDQKDIDGYTFKEVQGDTAGTFTEDAQTVTYVYTKNPVAGGDVTAKYVDEDGNEIAESVVKTGNVGEDYTTDQKDIDGYTFKEVQGDTAGTFTEDAQTVTYVYTKNPVAGGDVTARYVDEDGNEIAESVVKTGNVGEDYTTDQKDIDGYTFKEVQGDTAGTFTEDAQTVTYVYTKNPVAGGDVTAKYVDEDGNEIAESVVKTGNVGEDYTTDQKDIDGYTFKEVQGDANGKFTEESQTVTYVYTKNKPDVVTPVVDPKPDPKPDPDNKDESKIVPSLDNKDNSNGSNKEETAQISSSRESSKGSLPQTNDSVSDVGLISGLLILAGTLFTFLKRKKKN